MDGGLQGPPRLQSSGAASFLGISAVDVRLFGYGADQSLDATIGNMHRFRDGVLAKL